VTISTGGAGVVTLFLDGGQVATLTSQTHAAAVAQGVLGTQDTLSTTTGCLVFDQFVMDDTRVYPFTERYPQDLLLTKSSHVFVGAGCIDNISLLSGAGTNNTLAIYDTDRANTNDAGNVRLELKNTVASEIVDRAGTPVELNRGAFVSLGGTNPRALVKIGSAVGYSSAGAIRTLGTKRLGIV